ncbi:N-(5'-phosphoribosyl)anthranilate isomerase [Phycisphaerae bacterium RAS2]|nr:N-(5'-phosphoribosyl)anthranilate isomerase [Phycisphaerae bacterium RAS2]
MKVQNLGDAPIYARTYGELQLLCGSRQGVMNSRKADLKILRIRPGSETSHHYHILRESIFHVISGNLVMRSALAMEERQLGPGDTIIVEPGEDHVLVNRGISEAVLYEIESPPHASSDKIPFGSIRKDLEVGERDFGRFWRDDGKVKVKICGVKSLDAAVNCARLGVHAIGVHAVGQVAIEKVLSDSPWLAVVPQEMSVFLLTDGGEPGILAELIFASRCDTVQIQGGKSVSELAAIAETVRTYGRRLVCTVSAKVGMNKRDLITSTREAAAISDAVLFDAGHYGGTGQKHDWELTASLRDEIQVPVIAAGGLNRENCADCIRRLKPFGVDVESGVEVKFGLPDGGRLTAKDFSAIKELLLAANEDLG